MATTPARQWRRVEDHAPVAPGNVRWWNGVGYVERFTDRRVEAECRSCLGLGEKGGIVDAPATACEHCGGSGWGSVCQTCGGKGFEWVDGPYGYTTSAAAGVQRQVCPDCVFDSIMEDQRDFEQRMP